MNLSENPISAANPNTYRLVALKYLPNLEKLDDVLVNFVERQQAEKLDLNNLAKDTTMDRAAYKKNP